MSATHHPTTAERTRRRYSGNRAYAENCRKCGRAIIAGWESEPMAGFVILDPYILDTAGVIACHVTLGKKTVEIEGTPGNWRIRNTHSWPEWRGTIWPYDGPILPQHVCGTGPPSNNPLPTRHNYSPPTPTEPQF